MTTDKCRKTNANSTFAIGGVSSTGNCILVAESSLLRFNISGKIHPLEI